jgi:hypothetical protein
MGLEKMSMESMVEKYGKLKGLVVTNVGPVLACAWYEHGYEQ